MNDCKISGIALSKVLCSLYLKGEIDVFTKKRGRDGLFVAKRYFEREQITPLPDVIEQLIMTIEICSRLIAIKEIKKFHQATNQKFKKLMLFQFLENCDANFECLKILCRYLTAFFSGSSSISIMDLGLNKMEIIDISDQINNHTLLLQHQELIGFIKDRRGIYLNNNLNPRLLRLLKNETISVNLINDKNNKGLYYEIKYDKIKSCTLYYNDHEQELYQNIIRLISSNENPKNSNISILLYGKPGTGKTEFAYQIAKEIQADIMQLNFSEIQSKWVGETEKNIHSAFENYRKKQSESNRPNILLINEADGLMNRRVSLSRSNDVFHNQSQTQLLEILEDFKGIVIATTNLYKNIDEAFHRRFLFRYEITPPDRATRELILNNSIVASYISEKLSEKIIDDEWSPAQLKNIERKIKQLESIQKMDESKVENLFLQDGLLQQKRKLGFI
jgi:hypothetical protein